MSDTFIKIGALKVAAEDWVVPSDRSFRDAWDIKDANSGIIAIDMPKARDIYRGKLRDARKVEFEALDAAFMKALESGSDTGQIVSRKEELRDCTSDPAIEAAATPEALLALNIAGLGVK